MSPGANQTVLVVDDADDVFFARRALQKAGITGTILTCANGAEAIALLTKMRAEKRPGPQTIFLDIKMPHCDGFQTIQWIRGQALRGHLP